MIKKILTLIIILSVISPNLAFAALTDSINAYYKLDESSGNASDSTPNANTLTNTGTVTYVAAVINNGSETNGSSQYFVRGDTVSLSITGDMSVCAWVNFDSVASNQTFLSKWTYTGNQRSYSFGFNATNGITLSLSSAGSGESVANLGLATFTPSTETWYHICYVYTAASHAVQFYVNGSASGSSQDITVTSIFDSTASLSMSSSYDNTDGAYSYFGGKMDEVGIWARTLSGGEVSQLYNAGAGLQYPFTGGGTSFNFFQFFAF